MELVGVLVYKYIVSLLGMPMAHSITDFCSWSCTFILMIYDFTQMYLVKHMYNFKK